MAKFKKGDRVRCVNPDPEGLLTRGEKLTVEHVETCRSGTGFVYVKGGLAFWASRFAPVRRTVATKNRSRVDAGPRGVAFPVGAE
jgi:hypothetical protein